MLEDFENFTKANLMKINSSKTKVMKFNRAKSHDFPLEVAFSDQVTLEEVTEFKL